MALYNLKKEQADFLKDALAYICRDDDLIDDITARLEDPHDQEYMHRDVWGKSFEPLLRKEVA